MYQLLHRGDTPWEEFPRDGGAIGRPNFFPKKSGIMLYQLLHRGETPWEEFRRLGSVGLGMAIADPRQQLEFDICWNKVKRFPCSSSPGSMQGGWVEGRWKAGGGRWEGGGKVGRWRGGGEGVAGQWGRGVFA